MVATILIGLGLGWFRYFRLGNVVYASDNFDRDIGSDSGLLISLVFVLILLGLLIALFVPTPIPSFQRLFESGDWPQLQLSQLTLKYLMIGVIAGEVLRWFYILEGDEDNLGPADSFREFVNRWRPSVFAQDNLSLDFDVETLAGIDVCCWAYGIHPDVKLRLLKSIGRDFKIARSLRLNVLREMDYHTGRRGALPKSLRGISRYFGNDYDARRSFMLKAACVGKRSGFALSQVEHALVPVAAAIGLAREDFNSVISQASRVKSEYNQANQPKTYKQDRYWKEPDQYG